MDMTSISFADLDIACCAYIHVCRQHFSQHDENKQQGFTLLDLAAAPKLKEQKKKII